MKKSLMFITAIVTSLLLVLTSCNNATQITFEDESKPKFTEDGFSTLSVKLGKLPSYRSIFPEDWTEEKKGTLIYRLTGEPVNKQGGVTATQSSKLVPAKENKANVFSYEELNTGRAVITLDPIEWKLVLTAYQTKDETVDAGSPPSPVVIQVIDETKPVMSATIDKVDLSTGEQDVIFNLTTYNPTKPNGGVKPDGGNYTEADSDDQATGELDILVEFEMKPELLALVDRVDVDVVTKDDNTLSILPEKKVLSFKQGGPNDFTKIGSLDKYSVHVGKDGIPADAVKAGDYKLKITFFDKTTTAPATTGKIMLQHLENIKIDGGNLTKAFYYFEEDEFNRPPKAPTELITDAYFALADGENKLVINENKKEYAQQVIPSTELVAKNALGNDKATLDGEFDTATKDNRYNLQLNWKDNSFNEAGFKINLTTTNPNKNDIQIIWKENTNKVFYTVTEAYDTPDDDGTATGIKVVSAAPEKKFESSLEPSSETLTISLPMGVFCKNIKVTAFNELGENSSNTVTGPVGMFTVGYNLADPKKGDVGEENHLSTMTYAPGKTASMAYFVMAYDYGSEADLIGTNKLNYPYIENSLYNFEGWVYVDAEKNTKPINVKKMINFDDNAGPLTPDNWDEGKLATDSAKRNANVLVFGSWTTPATIKVTFPSYSEYKLLKAATNQNPYNTIEPVFDSKDKHYKVTFTVPKVSRTEAEMTNIIFRIYDPYKDATVVYETTTDSSAGKAFTGVSEADEDGLNLNQTVDGWSGGKSLVWDVTEFLKVAGNHGDVYRLNISYDYAKRKADATEYVTSTDYETPVTIDGNFFIKISK